MFQADKISRQAFSLCFARPHGASRDGTVAGAMSMGGADARLSTTPMVYCESPHVTSDERQYRVSIRAVHLRQGGGGDSAVSSNPDSKIVTVDFAERKYNRGKIIVDSGTTDTYFPVQMKTAFEEAWKDVVGSDFQHGPISLTDEELNALPTILVQLAGDVTLNQAIADQSDGWVTGLAGPVDPDHPLDVLVAMPPSHYYEYEDRKDGYVACFKMTESSGAVLGSSLMMGHDVLFDVEDRLVGWAESTCDYVDLAGEYFRGQEFVHASDKEAEDDEEPDLTPLPDRREPICTSLACQLSCVAAVITVLLLLSMRLLRQTAKEEDSMNNGNGNQAIEMAPMNSDFSEHEFT